MKKGRRKLIIILIIIILFTCIFINIKDNFSLTNTYNEYFDEYPVIKKDYNDNYEGIGQEKVKNKDGYFTTFTTTNKKKYIEYKQNGNASWSNKEYWNGVMKDTGCGITVMSIILSGYGYDYTPDDLRKKYYPVMDYASISSELALTYNIENSDFYYDSIHLSNKEIIKHLKSGRPIIICVWNNPEDNRWTTASHYMALLATDGEMVYVSNPNGLENNSKSSGWYNIDEVTPYIAKALFIEKY